MAVADIERFQQVLGNARSALIFIPQNPSFDAVAGGLALYLSLQKKGIEATVSCPSQMTVEFNRLVGINKIRADIGDKNLVISFANYPADNIERVSYNIEKGNFSLTVIPKPGNNAPRENQINLTYAGIAADLLLVVGANYPADLGRFAENKEIPENKNLTLLSNTPLSGWPRAVELIDPNGSSISEVTMDVIEQSNLPFDEDVATNLYLGIEAGTANFASGSVTAATFEKTAKLLRSGAQRAPVPRAPQPPQPPQAQQRPGEPQQQQEAPQDWLAPKVYKGSTLP